MYTTVQEVRNTLGVSETDIISDAVIEQAIEFAEDEIDRLTYTTYYPNIDSGTVTEATDTTLTDTSKTGATAWVEDEQIGYAVYIYDGTGKGQIREIIDNTTNQLTVATWTTNPDTTSKYIITYLNKQTVTIDGSGGYELLLRDYPIVQVDKIEIEGTEIDADDYVIYPEVGKIVLKDTASKAYFTKPIQNTYRKQVEITYHWGVLPEFKRNKIDINRVIKRATCLIASLQALAYQMGGTYDDLSTFSLPEFSGSIGQAYVNIRGVVNVMIKELDDYKKNYLGKYIYMA
jgi:hypothetical protein